MAGGGGHTEAVHHRLGFELPERTGFGGLWSAIDAAGDDERRTAPAAGGEERHPVATSHGARSVAVRRRLAAFGRAVAADRSAHLAA